MSKNSSSEDGKFVDSIVLDFAFAPKITKEQKEKIFYNLDFSVSTYSLNVQTYNFLSPSLGNNASQFLIVAAIIVFSFIAIFLVVNYGLLGALSTICAAFLIFLGLLMITVFRGEYSAEAIAALMVAVGIGLDFNIVFFERFKKELKSGNGLQKSLKKADKLTLTSSITKALALLITSAVIYVVGSLYLGTFSALILTMSIFISIIMFILIRILANLILGTKVFDDKPYLFGIYKKRSSSKVKKVSTEINKDEKDEFIALDETLELDFSTGDSRKLTISKKASALVLGVVAVVGATLFTTFSVLGSS
jgi:SecD/SecF fusion protein